MALIREVDPAPEVTISAPLPTSVGEVESMSLSQLLLAAEQLGIEVPAALPAAP